MLAAIPAEEVVAVAGAFVEVVAVLVAGPELELDEEEEVVVVDLVEDDVVVVGPEVVGPAEVEVELELVVAVGKLDELEDDVVVDVRPGADNVMLQPE